MVVPLVHLPQEHSQEVNRGTGNLAPSALQYQARAPPPYPLPTPPPHFNFRAGAWGTGGPAAGRLKPGAVRRKPRPGLFWSLKAAEGRERPAPALCELRSPLARLVPPGARSWRRLLGRPAGSQAGSNWAEGTRAALSFIYICIHQFY